MSSRGRRAGQVGVPTRSRRRPNKQPTASSDDRQRRRAADAHWRSEMASCFDVLRVLIPEPARLHRRRGGRSVLLRAAIDHLRYLEGVISDLLKGGDHGTVQTVRAGFSRHLARSNLPRRRRRRRRDSGGSEVIPSLEELVPEEPPKAFTAVKGPNVVVRAANVARAPLGDITNAARSSSTYRAARCEDIAGAIGRFGNESLAPSRRLDNLDSFYEDGAALSPLPPRNVASQVVPDSCESSEDAGRDSSSPALLEALQVAPSIDVTLPAGLVVQVNAESAVIVHDPMLATAQSPGRDSPKKSPPLYDAQLPEQWILGSEVDWIVDLGLSQMSEEL
ncbi:unnamed protein product [Ixodes hexagonus]